MWTLTRLFNLKIMKSIHIVLLLSGGFFLYSSSANSVEKVLLKDKFVYKVAGEVFSLNELKNYFKSVHTLKCIYKDSLLVRVFQEEFNLKHEKLYAYRTDFSIAQKNYFRGLIKFGKTLVYSKSHEVTINPSLVKYFYLMGKKNGCSLKDFDQKRRITGLFLEVVRLEIFLRTRFLPTESEGKSTDEDVKKAVIAARSLIKSIDEQLEQEIYW